LSETETIKSRCGFVALVGAPASGKSTLAEALAQMDPSIQVVPMDGFHFDNAVLEARGTLARKGAPFTFDADGYAALLTRLRTQPDRDIAVPVFDRELDLARAGGALITPGHRFLIAEGNYLLLDGPAWTQMTGLFDLTIMLTADMDVLSSRLIDRWLGYGLDPEQARARALSNDIPNAELFISEAEWAQLSEPHPEREWILREHIELPGAKWRPIGFEEPADPLLSPFGGSYDVMGDGTLVMIPTPGHTPGSSSLLVRSDGLPPVLLVGDLAYEPPLIWEDRVPGTGDAHQLKETYAKVRDLREALPDLVVLASHDPEAPRLLAAAQN